MADIKTLRVCLSKDLPPVDERSTDFIYLAYDKLQLHYGSSMMDDNFAIANAMPDAPVPGMIYILNTDGSAYRQIDYVNTKIAEIENASQIELLKKAGTIFYSNANNRYLDSQLRTLTLPFNNGTYELNVSMMNDQVFNNNTILKFNEEHERFEIYGEHSEEFIDFSKPFRGGETDSAKMSVDSGRLYAVIKICKAYDNLIKLSSDGLYVKISDKVSTDDYLIWKKGIDDFKKYAKNILDAIAAEVIHLEELITPETIKEKSMEVLRGKYPTIDAALENYQRIAESLDQITTELYIYTSGKVIDATAEIEEEVRINSNWNELDDYATTYVREIDYYKKAEEWLRPSIIIDKLKVIVAAIAKCFNIT